MVSEGQKSMSHCPGRCELENVLGRGSPGVFQHNERVSQLTISYIRPFPVDIIFGGDAYDLLHNSSQH